MESNTAEQIEVEDDKLTLEVIHKSFETDFAKLKRRLEITEDNMHMDTRNISMHVSEIIQEERDQKKSLMSMMGCLLVINAIVAIAAIITFTMMISQ